MTELETTMPKVAYATVNGVRLAYYEVGPRDGVPLIFCHGFPELAFSWRHQLAACQAAGRWALAIDGRGYGLTAGPEAVSDYDMTHLTGDLVGLLDHLGCERAVFCGHDWGGIVVWQMPLLHPERVAGVISLNTPFMPRPPADPIAILRKRHGEAMYIVQFQIPGEADAILARDVDRTIDFFMRKPLPGPVDGAGMSKPREPGERSRFALIKSLEAWDAASDRRARVLTAAEHAVFVEAFMRGGFTGPINWYRNFTRNWEQSAHLEQRVKAPALMIMAENDAVLPPASADGMEAYIDDLEKALITECGHWTQQEQPVAVNLLILDWMNRRFPL